MSIRHLLIGKNASQRAQMKSKEFAKIKPHIFKHKNLKIDVQSIEEIENGIQVFARAWKNGEQIGFGADGTVDIERFRILNPPILVDDPLGDINMAYVEPETKKIRIRKLRENPMKAMEEVLADTIKKVGKGGESIINGKVGKTTDTIYATNDGQVSSDAKSTWALSHDATSGTLGALQQVYAYWRTVDGLYYITRSFDDFVTTGIPTGNTISSAIVSLQCWFVTPRSGLCGINIYSSTSSSTLAAGDFDLVGTTEFSTTQGFGTFTPDVYADFTLNASGIAAIVKGGTTKFSVREANFDATNISPAQDDNPNIAFYNSSEAGTTKDPKIVIEHAAAVVADPFIPSPGPAFSGGGGFAF